MSGGQAGHREQDRQTNRALSSSRKPKYAAKKKKLLPRLISGITFYSVKDLKVWHRNVCYNKWWNWNKKSNFSGNYLLNRKSDINNLKLAHFKRWSKYAILTFLLAKSKKKQEIYSKILPRHVFLSLHQNAGRLFYSQKT